MSQAKVDKYKKEKANRQKIMKKEKRLHRLEMTAIGVVCAVFVGWIYRTNKQFAFEYELKKKTDAE